jgi:hypothetical protein
MQLDWYFRPRAFELEGQLYEWLGVRRFKTALMRRARVGARNRTANAYALGGRNAADLRRFEQLTRRSELIHLGGVVASVVCLLIGVWGVRIMLVTAAAIFLTNFHCLILQRYNRIRIFRTIGRARGR